MQEEVATTVTKVSDTEVEVREVTPEVIIPEKVVTKVLTLKELREKKEAILMEKEKWIGYRNTPLAELEKIDAKIAELDKEANEIQTLIDEATAQGVKEEVVEVVADPVVVDPVVEDTP